MKKRKSEGLVKGLRLSKPAHMRLGYIAAKLECTKTQALERAVDYAALHWLGQEALDLLEQGEPVLIVPELVGRKKRAKK